MSEILNETYCFGNKTTFTWKIHEFFKSYELLQSQRISSEDFTVDNNTYRLEAYMWNGGVFKSRQGYNATGCFKVDMFYCESARKQQVNMVKERKVVYTIIIVNTHGNFENKRERWISETSGATTVLSVSARDLVLYRKSMVPDNTLTILVEFTPQFFSHRITGMKQKADGISHLLELSTDVGKLLEESSTADFFIRVQGVDIPAHSIILASRSPVFKAMMTGESKEAQEKIVEIHDFTKLTMHKFLEYIYTGKLTKPEVMPTELLMELYIAADKYSVLKLVDMCTDNLLEGLSEDNMEKIVRMACRHNDQKILDFVVDFVSRRKEILQGDKWNRLAQNVPSFGLRVLAGVLKRQKMV